MLNREKNKHTVPLLNVKSPIENPYNAIDHKRDSKMHTVNSWIQTPIHATFQIQHFAYEPKINNRQTMKTVHIEFLNREPLSTNFSQIMQTVEPNRPGPKYARKIHLLKAFYVYTSDN